MWVAAGAEQEFKLGINPIIVHGERLIVCKFEGVLSASAAKCPHGGFRMERAELEGTILTCPLHGWRFDMACSGKETHGYRGLKPREIRVEDGIVYVSARV